MDIVSATMPERYDALSWEQAADASHSHHVTADPTSASFGSAIDWSDHFAAAAQASVLICSDETFANPYAPHLPAMTQAAGHRILDVLPIHAAGEHLAGLVALDAVILSCSGHEPGLDALLGRLDSMAEAGTLTLLVITDLAGLDHVHALVHSRSAVILCEPESVDMAAALVTLERHGPKHVQLHDSGNGDDTEAHRFDLLSDQLLKLNRMIEALVQDKTPEETVSGWGQASATVKSPGRSYSAESEDLTIPHHKVYAHQVRAVLRARRLREQVLSPDLFADPAWDILLDLLAARLENTRVSVSSLCIAAAVPPTTALRWIRQLTDRGLLERQADPRDGRRIFIGLSDAGSAAVTRWFQQSRSLLQAALHTTYNGQAY